MQTDEDKYLNTDIKIGRVIDTLCYWLYPYSDSGEQYINSLVGTIHRIFSSGYMRVFYADRLRFFTLIEDISTKYVGLEMNAAVTLAYRDECRVALTSGSVPILSFDS